MAATGIDLNNEEVRKRITQLAVAQINHIAQHGCSGFKCKRCALNNLCIDKRADQSKELAQSVITYARSLPNEQ